MNIKSEKYRLEHQTNMLVNRMEADKRRVQHYVPAPVYVLNSAHGSNHDVIA